METMRFQIRHKRLGLYQGEFIGMAFWHPMSKISEAGIADFTYEEAENLIEFLSAVEFNCMRKNDFEIEPFDEKYHAKLVEKGCICSNIGTIPKVT